LDSLKYEKFSNAWLVVHAPLNQYDARNKIRQANFSVTFRQVKSRGIDSAASIAATWRVESAREAGRDDR